jgi:O-methyltransferase
MIRRALFRLLGEIHPFNLGVGVPRRGRLSRERYRMMTQALEYTHDEQVGGDFLEFGVGDGRSLCYAYDIARAQGEASMRFVGFDSFQGFPEPKGIDAVFERFKKGQMSFARSVVERNLSLLEADRSRIDLVEGWYEETLKPDTLVRLGLKKARIINIDCDLYDSTLLALRFAAPLVGQGTVILFDDWFCYRGDPARGEQAAARQWLLENPGLSLAPYRQYGNVGQSFVISSSKT